MIGTLDKGTSNAESARATFCRAIALSIHVNVEWDTTGNAREGVPCCNGMMEHHDRVFREELTNPSQVNGRTRSSNHIY